MDWSTHPARCWRYKFCSTWTARSQTTLYCTTLYCLHEHMFLSVLLFCVTTWLKEAAVADSIGVTTWCLVGSIFGEPLNWFMSPGKWCADGGGSRHVTGHVTPCMTSNWNLTTTPTTPTTPLLSTRFDSTTRHYLPVSRNVHNERNNDCSDWLLTHTEYSAAIIGGMSSSHSYVR